VKKPLTGCCDGIKYMFIEKSTLRCPIPLLNHSFKVIFSVALNKGVKFGKTIKSTSKLSKESVFEVNMIYQYRNSFRHMSAKADLHTFIKHIKAPGCDLRLLEARRR